MTAGLSLDWTGPDWTRLDWNGPDSHGHITAALSCRLPLTLVCCLFAVRTEEQVTSDSVCPHVLLMSVSQLQAYFQGVLHMKSHIRLAPPHTCHMSNITQVRTLFRGQRLSSVKYQAGSKISTFTFYFSPFSLFLNLKREVKEDGRGQTCRDD